MRLKYRGFAILLSICLGFSVPAPYVYASESDEEVSHEDATEESPTAQQGTGSQLINSLSASFSAAPEISAETAVIIDATTGVVLYDKKMNQRMYPASMTKVISAVVALEHASLTDEVKFSEEAIYSLAWDDMNIGINVGEVLTMKDAILGMLLPSANECANGVAEAVAGSNDKFKDMMNEWAKSVGAVNSHFITPSGLHDPDHYTTAYDMAIMARAAIQNQEFLALEQCKQYDITARSAEGSRQIEVYARHEMADEEGFIAGKTGFEEEAGHTLMTCMERGGTKLITVVMNAESYYADTAALMDFGFRHFTTTTVAQAAPSLFSSQSGEGFYSIFDSNFYPITIDPSSVITSVIGMTDEDISVTASYDMTNAPVTADGAVGYASFSCGDLLLGYTPIIKQTVPAVVLPSDKTEEKAEETALLPFLKGVPIVIQIACVILLIVLVIALLCVVSFTLLLIRKLIVERKRKKMREKRAAQRRAKQRRERLESTRIRKD